MGATRLGRVQLLIMQVLWDKGRATAREITDAINASEPIAHSTVQTLLRGLEEKGAVSHEAEGRTFVFLPLVAEDKFKRSTTPQTGRTRVRRQCGYAGGAFAQERKSIAGRGRRDTQVDQSPRQEIGDAP